MNADEELLFAHSRRVALERATREDAKPKPIIVKERRPEVPCAPPNATLH
jgi:hypothetical protein